MRKRLITLLLFTAISGGSAFAQKSDLSKAVEKIKTGLLATYGESGGKVSEGRYIPILINGDPMSYEMLDEYSLKDVKQITISFDRQLTLLYGDSGKYGIIQIQLIEKKE